MITKLNLYGGEFMSRLIKNSRDITSDKYVMFCFPFAGGGAGAFNSYIHYFKSDISVCPIQLPGREEKIMDAPYTDMNDLVRDLLLEIREYKENKIILFGHSMGAKIAYEVAKELESEDCPVKLLIVSGNTVPHIPEPNPIHHLPDEEFERELGRFSGTPKEVLENKELLKFFLPMLKADFTMIERYCLEKVIPLQCPILGLGGTLDKEADKTSMDKWREYTKNSFNLFMFEGGHFFIKDKQKEVCNTILKAIIDLQKEEKGEYLYF